MCFGFLDFIALIAIAAKLIGYLNCSWFFVLIPVWASIAIGMYAAFLEINNGGLK